MALKRYPEAETAYLGCEETFRRRNALGQKERAELDRATDDEIRTLRNDVQRARSSAGGQAGYSVEQYVIRMEDRIRVLQSSKLKGAEVARVPAELYVALGSACLRQNKLEDAERAYTSAVKADKKLGAAHNNLAVVYMLTGRFAEAEEALRRAESAGFHVSPQLKSDLKQRAEAAQR
jgi:tetratricopeptide (TPR) repeat protein